MRGTSSAPPDKRPERPVLPGGPKRLSGPPDRRKSRLIAGAVTVAVHVIMFAVLFWPRTARPPSHTVPSPPPLQVSLLETPKPTPPGPPEPVMLQPASVDVAPPHLAMRAPMSSAFTVPDTSDLLSNSQLAGAATAGEGGGGGGTCDMARAVQQALRRDPMVREAVEEAHRSGKAIMIWNGDWVRNGDQDGKGLSAVREAITWEVAFAPEACRNTRMHGLVLLSLVDGSTRFAVGSNDWRWSDLLGVRSGAP